MLSIRHPRMMKSARSYFREFSRISIPLRLAQIWHDMYGIGSKRIRSFPEAPLLSSPPGPPRELAWDLSDHLKEEVQRASQEFRRECNTHSLDTLAFHDFGKNACKVRLRMLSVPAGLMLCRSHRPEQLGAP